MPPMLVRLLSSPSSRVASSLVFTPQLSCIELSRRRSKLPRNHYAGGRAVASGRAGNNLYIQPAHKTLHQ
jgi:hypothetical protein